MVIISLHHLPSTWPESNWGPKSPSNSQKGKYMNTKTATEKHKDCGFQNTLPNFDPCVPRLTKSRVIQKLEDWHLQNVVASLPHIQLLATAALGSPPRCPKFYVWIIRDMAVNPTFESIIQVKRFEGLWGEGWAWLSGSLQLEGRRF